MPEQAVEGAGPEVAAPPLADDKKRRAAVYSNQWRKRNPEKARAWQLAWRRKNAAKDRAYMKRFHRSQRGCFLRYQSGAKKRGLAFDLSFDSFVTLWQKDCRYCGSVIVTIGLDRVDNTLGYSLRNIVPCCSRCNGAKSNMTCEQFATMCRHVARHMEK